MVNKTVKAINFEVNLKGRGIVNFDGSGKGFLMQEYIKDNVEYSKNYSNGNIKVAKKVYTESGYKVKISSGCLRKAIYNESMEYITSEIGYSKTVLSSVIANKTMITRGYLFASDSGFNVKRKSILSVSDAIQTNDAKVVLDTCTTTGNRSDTSFFGVESVGDITYKSTGSISIKDLQFISTDPRYDRLAVPHDWANEETSIYRAALQASIPNINPKVGYFISKTSVNKIGRYAESGILVNDEAIEYIVKDLLTNIRKIFINRATAFAKVESFKIQLISDVFEDNTDGDWIEINSLDDIDKLQFNFEQFYEEVSPEEVEKNRSEIDALMNKGEKKKKGKKSTKTSNEETEVENE